MAELTKFQKEFIDKHYFKCDYCDFEIFVCDVISLNKFTGHISECPINKETIIKYDAELAKTKLLEERLAIHEKYQKLLK